MGGHRSPGTRRTSNASPGSRSTGSSPPTSSCRRAAIATERDLDRGRESARWRRHPASVYGAVAALATPALSFVETQAPDTMAALTQRTEAVEERTDRLETVLAAFMERADHAIARIDEAMERTSFDRPNAPDRAGSPMSRREGRAACRRTRSPRRGSPRRGSWWTGRGTGRRPRTVSWTVAHLERGDVARPAAEHSTPIR